ncbi:hypothetical protein JOD43_002608 [Pullulanibacillus pueri]|uniref:Glycosyl transferase n=1 Tax=Pullulanibacillus pueri TaxID=1437324 RepID=A0A8J2ZWG1_9BACL|nr:glycosyltransferase [Pullulanibacillus pueri]MBM7682431.1 hypothetical protein [Pullulanibacillus pueri]GGH81665.1 glycosyl transferase [Pullulanibacillus pueri]
MTIKRRTIPKTIHYCWFGKKEQPEMIKKCISSWNKLLIDYEFKEWNEDNFDIHCHPYVSKAYQLGKYAFVSDYVRVYALYHFGGIYLDTDVEVFKPFDDLLDHESFWGFEQENYIATSTIGALKGNPLLKEFLGLYDTQTFMNEPGKLNDLTNVAAVTQLLEAKGLKTNGQYQKLEGIGAFYPKTYFSPYDYINCRKFITNDTYTIHHFYKSWLPVRARVKSKIKKVAASVIGGESIAKIRKTTSRL